MIPELHAAFLRAAVPRLAADARLVGVGAGGSYLSGALDEWSDLDLVVAVEPSAYAAVVPERSAIAGRLGTLLAAFTGEHVGEPRVLICLYGPPLLHVDLKFVSLPELAQRVEDPKVLWEREGRMSAALAEGRARFPEPELQWIEDRFWVWIHYGATKVARGELFEAHDFLAFLRLSALGPLALKCRGARPTGVRKLEQLAPEMAEELRATLASYDRASLLDALEAAARIFVKLRGLLSGPDLVLRREAQAAALEYLEELRAR